MAAEIHFLRDGVIFSLERASAVGTRFEVRALTQGEHDEQEADARDMTNEIRYFDSLKECVQDLLIMPSEIEAAAQREKEGRHLIVEVDPRDACLDEIAELLRGEVGADEIAEISRIVESSGRHIGSESERLEKEAYARERMGSRRLPGGHG